MEALTALLPLLLTGSLAGLVMTVGLNSGQGELVYVVRRPALLGRSIVAVLIIPVVVAAFAIWLLPLDPVVKAGIMLMAISPVPPLVPGKELGVGGRKEFAYGLYIAMALLTVISVPVTLNLASRLFGRDDSITMARIAATLLTGVLIPLAVGILIRVVAPRFAAKAAPWVYKLSSVLVVLAFLPILIKVWPAIRDLIGDGTLWAMAAVVALCMVGGHLLGGPDWADRGTLAMAASVRHPGIAAALAAANFEDRRVVAAVLLFMLVGMALGIPYKMWMTSTTPPEADTALV